MKLPILGAIAFIAGLAGATGAVMAKGGARADSTGAKTTVPTEAKQDSAATRDSAGTDSTRVAAHDSMTGAAPTLPKVPAAPSAGPETRVAAPIAEPVHASGPTRDFGRLAKLIGAMPAAQAAELLGLLDDGDVEGVLRALGVKQAAGILTVLPKPRAALLSRRLLVPAGNSTQ